MMLLDLIKKGLLVGLGATVVTRELIGQTTGQLVKEGKLSTEEARRLADDLMESGRQSWESVEQEARDTIQKAVDSMGLVKKSELETLQTRVALLEQQVLGLREELAKAGESREEAR